MNNKQIYKFIRENIKNGKRHLLTNCVFQDCKGMWWVSNGNCAINLPEFDKDSFVKFVGKRVHFVENRCVFIGNPRLGALDTIDKLIDGLFSSGQSTFSISTYNIKLDDIETVNITDNKFNINKWSLDLDEHLVDVISQNDDMLRVYTDKYSYNKYQLGDDFIAVRIETNKNTVYAMLKG